ncbi:DUF5819 family protein [Nocardia sp. NPDC001965]
MAISVFVICVTLYNMPDSTVRTRSIGPVTDVMHPYLQQDWHLFAPNPPTVNRKLWVSVRVERGPDVVELPEFDIQYAIEDMPRSRPWLPTKQPEVTRASQDRMRSYVSELIAIKEAPAEQQAGLHRDLNTRFQGSLRSISRIISKYAEARYPELRILEVRARFTQTDIVPFSRRFSTTDTMTERDVLETAWFPFVPGVGGE